MLPRTASKLAKEYLKRPHHFSRHFAWIHNANLKSALLIETQANEAFRMPRSLDRGGLGSAQNNWLPSKH